MQFYERARILKKWALVLAHSQSLCSHIPFSKLKIMNHNDILIFQSASTNTFIYNAVFPQQKTHGVLAAKQWHYRLLGCDIQHYNMCISTWVATNCLHRQPERLFNGVVRNSGL
jgi:hypothetical protein